MHIDIPTFQTDYIPCGKNLEKEWHPKGGLYSGRLPDIIRPNNFQTVTEDAE